MGKEQEIQKNIKKATPVERAHRRLDKAVARLEAAVAARGDEDRLSAELAAMRNENAALRDVNKTVSTRLDGAIDRLRAVLGR